MGNGFSLLTKWNKFKPTNFGRLFYAHPRAAIKPNIAYHGSPFNFSHFDAAKIGTGEGCCKKGVGLYLFRTPRNAPYFANIRSKNAPIHLGCTKPLENPQPRIYTVDNLGKLNLKQVSQLEAKQIARTQAEFERMYPEIDGIELPSTEICVFPKSINKLHIGNKQTIPEFIADRPNYPFRQWKVD